MSGFGLPLSYMGYDAGVTGLGLYKVSSTDIISNRLIQVAASYGGLELLPYGTYTVRAADCPIAIPAGFIFKSGQQWGLPFGGSTLSPNSVINASSVVSGDVFQVSGTTTVGAIFQGVSIVGNTSGGLIHFGGGQRDCRLEDVYLYNASTSTLSAGLLTDTALVNANGEDNHFYRVSSYGGYAGIMIGVGDQSQKVNNCDWHSITTGGGQYGIYQNEGGHHDFRQWYDRSNPAVACYYIASGNAYLHGGEHQNTSTQAANLSVAGGFLQIDGSVTQSTGQVNTVTVTGGELSVENGSQINGAQTWSVTGGKVLFARGVLNAGSNLTVTGTTPAVIYYPTVPMSGTPTHTGYGGTWTSY